MLVVIGVVHCPSLASPDLAAAYAEFRRLCRQFPAALAARCFAFEPSEAQAAQDSTALPDLVLFPPGAPSSRRRLCAQLSSGPPVAAAV